MDLTEFVLARVAEDEAVAQRLAAAYEADEVRPPARLINHDALAIPARVLAECAAKRAIVGIHSEEAGHECPADSPADPHTVFGADCPTLRALAAVYADHPDYRAEWALDPQSLASARANQ